MHTSSSESRSSCYVSTVSSFNKPRSASTPPTSIAPSSSPTKDSPPISSRRKKITIGDSTPQFGQASTVVPMKSCGVNGDRYKRTIQYALSQGGAHDEDCEPPAKRLKTLQTTWNYTSSSEATSYLNERMLELSRITRRAITARIRYQRLRSRELELSRSIIEDEKELSESQLKGIDLQIGSIRNTLQDAGVTVIGNKGCRFDPSDMGPWCESSSDNDSDVAPVPIDFGSRSSICTSDVEE